MNKVLRNILCVSPQRVQDEKSLDMFEEFGLTLQEVSSGAEALLVIENSPVNMIVVEEELPDMSGIELLRSIQSFWPGTSRILLCDLQETKEGLIQALRHRFCHAILSSPLDYSDLFRLVTVESHQSEMVGTDLISKTMQMPSFEEIQPPYGVSSAPVLETPQT